MVFTIIDPIIGVLVSPDALRMALATNPGTINRAAGDIIFK